MRHTTLATLLGATLLLATAGCQEELDPPSLINKPRVLAIVADPPEVAPGGTVNISLLTAAPTMATERLAWSACLIPERGTGFFGGGGSAGFSGGQGYGLDDAGTCTDSSATDFVDLGNGMTAQVTIPADFLNRERYELVYGLPEDADVSPQALLGFGAIAGLNYTISLVYEQGGERVEAFKRVNVSLAAGRNVDPNFTVPEQNANPVNVAFHIKPASDTTEPPLTAAAPAPVGGIQRCVVGEGSQPLTLTVPGDYTLTAVNIPDPQEQYPVLIASTEADGQGFDVEINEENLFYSWFSTAGTFDSDVTKASTQRGRVTWSLDSDVLGTVPIWVVTRDGRGGTTWCESQITLVAP